MTLNDVLKIIEEEQLDVYNKIVYGSIYTGGENCLSFQKNDDGSFRICAIGERGKVVFDEVIKDESVACEKIVNRLRVGKRLALRFENNSSIKNNIK